jgi:ABC-type uncharacterized transport system substrate-binding protein
MYKKIFTIMLISLLLVACGGNTNTQAPVKDAPTVAPAEEKEESPAEEVAEEEVATEEATTEEATTEEATMKKLVVVNSYEDGFWGVVEENNGVVRALEEQGYTDGENIEITYFHMDTKTVNKTQEQMAAVARDILAQIEEIGPDAVYITDDDATRHVGGLLLDTDIPVVFAAVNVLPTKEDYSPVGALADSQEKPGHNITGVLENISLKAGFELMHQILPEAKTAFFITDNSSISNLLMEGGGGTEQLDEVAIEVVDRVFTNDFEELKKQILDNQDKVDVIVLFLPWSIVDTDGNHVPHEEVVAWLVQNSKRPSIGFLDMLVKEGYLAGTVVDMEQQGYHAGLMIDRIFEGENPAEMPIIDPVANRILINLARADQLGIDIPFEVLESADEVYDTMTAYPEYEMSKE